MLLPSTCLMSYPRLGDSVSWYSEHYAKLLNKALETHPNSDLTEETIIPENISSQDIVRIRQIEQDAWAHGIEEYLMCRWCGNVVWKDSLYWKLPRCVQKRTVSRIEDLLWSPKSQCWSCGQEMAPIYGEEYLREIQDRYINSKSYVSVLRDHEAVIQWFIDAYVDDFSTIYRREFSSYYGSVASEEEMKLHIEKTLWREMPDKLLFWTSVALNERYRNLANIYRLLRIFFMSMDIRDEYTCLSEARVWTNISQIYLKMWAKACQISELTQLWWMQWKALGVDNEIYLQDDIIALYRKKLQMSKRDFWRFCFR